MTLARATAAVAVDVHDFAHSPHGARLRGGDWENHSGSRSEHHHRRHPLKSLLVRALHAVERLCVFVRRLSVKGGVLHVEFLARHADLGDCGECDMSVVVLFSSGGGGVDTAS